MKVYLCDRCGEKAEYVAHRLLHRDEFPPGKMIQVAEIDYGLPIGYGLDRDVELCLPCSNAWNAVFRAFLASPSRPEGEGAR